MTTMDEKKAFWDSLTEEQKEAWAKKFLERIDHYHGLEVDEAWKLVDDDELWEKAKKLPINPNNRIALGIRTAKAIAIELVLYRTKLLEVLTAPGWTAGSGKGIDSRTVAIEYSAAKENAQDFIYRIVKTRVLDTTFFGEERREANSKWISKQELLERIAEHDRLGVKQ